MRMLSQRLMIRPSYLCCRPAFLGIVPAINLFWICVTSSSQMPDLTGFSSLWHEILLQTRAKLNCVRFGLFLLFCLMTKKNCSNWSSIRFACREIPKDIRIWRNIDCRLSSNVVAWQSTASVVPNSGRWIEVWLGRFSIAFLFKDGAVHVWEFSQGEERGGAAK